MATLATQSIVRTGTGLTPAYTAASGGGDRFSPGDRTFLHVKNGSGGALTVTVVTPPEAISGVGITDPAYSVPAGSERMIGPFPGGYFAATDGLVDVTYSGVTSLTIGAFAVS